MKKNRKHSKQTLDAKHKKKLKEYDLQRSTLDEKKKELEHLINKFDILDKKTNLSSSQVICYKNIKNKVDELSEYIKRVENNNNILDYYYKAYAPIIKYYSFNSKKKTKKVFDIMDILSGKNNNDEDKHVTKSSLHKSYSRALGEEVKKKKKFTAEKCQFCNVEKVLLVYDSAYICKSCGLVEPLILDYESSNSSDSSTDKQAYAYKRINHLFPLLAAFLFIVSSDYFAINNHNVGGNSKSIILY